MVAEYVVRWTGGRIGAGATVFHMNGTSSPTAATAAADAVQAWVTAIRPLIPLTVTMRPDSEMKILAATGELQDIIPISGRVSTTGTQSGVYASGIGGMIRWSTSAVVAGRRLQGRSFLVPMGSAQFGADGNVTNGAQTTGNTAAANLISALAAAGLPLCVWSKKNAVTSPVLSGTLLARPSTLRSRNDRD